MKNLILILVITALIAACKKDDPQPVTPKYWCEWNYYKELGGTAVDSTVVYTSSACMTQAEIDDKKIRCSSGGSCFNVQQKGRCN